ncbi:matrix metalloproteinase-21, partial [Aplysia californica]
MRWRRRQLVGSVLALPLLAVLVLGEPFYQRRDHLDQTKYLKVTNENVVKDRTDAEFVLSKYGYLRCHVTRRRREATHPRHRAMTSHFSSFLSSLAMVEEGGEETCDESEVQKAIRNYQRTYNLPETGELDEETKSFMSTSRCGNKDSEKDKSAPLGDEEALNVLVTDSQTAARAHHHNNQHSPVMDDGEDNFSSTSNGHRLWRRSARRGAT